MSDLELYKENVLDHYKNPLNKKVLENYTHTARELNPLCGDELTIYLLIEDYLVKDVSFQGKGCAISQAAASLFTEKIKGMSLKDAQKLGKEEIFSLLGVPITYSREKCALLILEVLNKC